MSIKLSRISPLQYLTSRKSAILPGDIDCTVLTAISRGIAREESIEVWTRPNYRSYLSYPGLENRNGGQRKMQLSYRKS